MLQSATPTPLPTLLNLPPFTTSFDPLHMLATSSDGPAIGFLVKREPADDEGLYFLGDHFQEPVDAAKGALGASPRRYVHPKARDIRMVGNRDPPAEQGEQLCGPRLLTTVPSPGAGSHSQLRASR